MEQYPPLGLLNPDAIGQRRREEDAQMDALADRIVDKLLARLRAADADSLDRLLLQGMIDKHGRG